MVVLSLFDGMSCLMQALKNLGVKPTAYFASEIDSYAIKVAKVNHPEIIHIGDVTKVRYSDGKLHTENGVYDVPTVDLLAGGSPCQGFSSAGKGLNFDDPRSKLFFDFVRIKEEVKPTHFLLENVVPKKKEWQEIISQYMGVEPIKIDSADFVPQTRNRLYWTDLAVGNYIPKNVNFESIKDSDASKNTYYTKKALEWIVRHSGRKGKTLKVYGEGNRSKMQMLEASMYKSYSSQRFFGIADIPKYFDLDESYQVPDLEVFKELHDKSKYLRYITPLEAERCQGLPDGYSSCVSNTQRYKMLGNGWTVPVIEHLLKKTYMDGRTYFEGE